MFNLSVKLSVLSARYSPISPQVFLDRTSAESLAIFMDMLPKESRYTLGYAFSPKAILFILENEFEVQVVKRQIIFNKQSLDSQSWLFANGLSAFPSENEELIQNLEPGLYQKLLPVHNFMFPIDNKEPLLHEELKTLISLYNYKYQAVGFLNSLQTLSGIRHFLNLVVAEALNKADAAEVLFGRGALYTRLWREKQKKFYSYASYLEHFPFRQSA